MKLKDLLTTETWNKFGDMDVYNDTTDSIHPAWCGNTFTAEGLEHYKEALELEAEVRTVWGYPSIVVLIDDKDDKVWQHRLGLVCDLFCDMAGYCTEEEYDAWFKEEE